MTMDIFVFKFRAVISCEKEEEELGYYIQFNPVFATSKLTSRGLRGKGTDGAGRLSHVVGRGGQRGPQ